MDDVALRWNCQLMEGSLTFAAVGKGGATALERYWCWYWCSKQRNVWRVAKELQQNRQRRGCI